MCKMTRRWVGTLPALCLLAFSLSFGCTPPRAAPTQAPEAVQADIRKALDLFNDTSGRGDLKGVLALFDDQADILLVGSDKGEVFKGRAAVEGWLAKLYKGNGFNWQMDRVELSHHGDTAWVFVEGEMKVRDKTNGKLRFSAPYRFSGVLVRRGDGWVWRLFHGSAPGKE